MHLLTSNNFHNTKIYPFSKKTSWKGGHWAWGDSHTKVTGILVGKFKFNPEGRPMWVWLNRKLTPEGDHTRRDITAFFVNFFMPSPKRYLNEQMSLLSIPNSTSETKICNLHGWVSRQAPSGSPPESLVGASSRHFIVSRWGHFRKHTHLAGDVSLDDLTGHIAWHFCPQ